MLKAICPPKIFIVFVVLFVLVCDFSQSTAMVMSRWSVNLTTFFLGQVRQSG